MNGLTARPYGPHATLVNCGTTDPQLVAEAIRRRLPESAALEEIVPATDTVLLIAPALTHEQRTAFTHDLDVSTVTLPSRMIELRVRYNGDDLETLADDLGVSVERVIAAHTSAEYRVDFLGFSPGFPYLSGGNPLFADVPRRRTPRLSVPAGAVGVAAGRTCVYPTESPGGWNLIGTTTESLFDPNATPMVLLQPGDTVRFVEVPA
jgi:KipI family sensor histidine kinase inhibitor